MKFNVNDVVRVKLTDHGRAVHAADHATFWAKVGKAMEYRPPEEDEDGWSRWQLWHLMQAFGPHITLGMAVPFETEIEIPVAVLNAQRSSSQEGK